MVMAIWVPVLANRQEEYSFKTISQDHSVILTSILIMATASISLEALLFSCLWTTLRAKLTCIKLSRDLKEPRH